jgi:hypothetical protein
MNTQCKIFELIQTNEVYSEDKLKSQLSDFTEEQTEAVNTFVKLITGYNLSVVMEKSLEDLQTDQNDITDLDIQLDDFDGQDVEDRWIGEVS